MSSFRYVIGALLACVAVMSGATPESVLQLDSQNPHYFLFRGKPTVLVTSGEHYGAVVNLDFDFKAYLDTLALDHLNLTRTFIGSYREIKRDYDPKKGKYAIDRNPLAPEADRFIAPWIRTGISGALDGGNKFDLNRWNPAYFLRLRDFIREAERRNVIVELTLFCSYYDDYLWSVSPLNTKNNVNRVGTRTGKEAYTLGNTELLKAQESLVRKIVDETKDFDNIYFEICNEPYWGSVTLEWQRHISGTIAEAEKNQAVRHLISQNVAQGSARIEQPDPNVSILNFHYSRPPDSVEMNYALNRAVGMNETGFDGSNNATYRIQAWDFLVAGGALYNNLDFSFTAGHERGDFAYQPYTPGGGSSRLRKELRVLLDFFNALPLSKMAPHNEVILKGSVLDGASARILAQPGKVYVLYLHHGRVLDETAQKETSGPQYVVDTKPHQATVSLAVPGGPYDVIWMDTKTGRYIKRDDLVNSGGSLTLNGPSYTEDVVLWLVAKR